MAKDYTEFFEELFGRGAGDPDAHGYPGQPSDDTETSKDQNQNANTGLDATSLT